MYIMNKNKLFINHANPVQPYFTHMFHKYHHIVNGSMLAKQ